MATTTTNLGLRKPENPDQVNVTTDISDSMQTLDQQWSEILPSTVAMDGAPSVGGTTVVARANHQHGGPGFGAPVSVGAVNQEGEADTVARSDHVHSGSLVAAWQHAESLILEGSQHEDVNFYVPGLTPSRKLVLRGRLARAGQLAAHDHTATGGGGGGAVTSGNASVDHAHAVLSTSVVHDHSTSSSSSHSHTTSTDGTGEHTLRADSDGDTVDTFSGSPSNRSGLVGGGHQHDHDVSGGSHGHGDTGSDSTSHDHGNTSGVSADHTHQVTIAAHAHTIGSTGSGGWAAGLRPAGVSVAINGVDRTSALGGPWGNSAADWDTAEIDIGAYIGSTGWHEIEVWGTTPGRLKVHLVGY